MGIGNGSHPSYSAHVRQAQGVVSVQADCTMAEALILMERRSRELNVPLEELAVDVIAHRVWFK
jgi:hypothetical protein